MENMPGFNLRAKIVGQGGAYVKHIQNETRCRVQIKGRNSGFLEHGTGAESEEPMYLHVASPDAEQVERAKQLCESLVDSVRQDYENFKANPPVQRLDSYLDGYGQDANAGRGYGGGYRERRRDDSYSNNYSGYSQNNSHYGSATPSTPAPGTSDTPSAAQTYQDQVSLLRHPAGSAKLIVQSGPRITLRILVLRTLQLIRMRRMVVIR